MGGIFVNYRDVDERHGAGALHGLLARYFGEHQVFRDVDSMLPGDHYPAALRAGLEGCDVLVAVIGQNWATCTDDHGVRRLDRPRDWVRYEIARTFARGVPVVPVLMDATSMPEAAALPEEIRPLVYQQAFDARHRSVGEDARRLAELLLLRVPALLVPRLFEKATGLPDEIFPPSALLHAEHEVVPFEHRRAELAGLLDWAASPESLSTRLVTGPAGQGKTRLAHELCVRLRVRGWTADTLARDVPAEVLTRVGELRTPLLLVMDYAEGRTAQVLGVVEALLDRPHDASAPARLLLLSRSAGEWRRRLHDHRDERVATVFATEEELSLPALVTGATDRYSEFVRALTAFGHRLGRPVVGVDPPGDFDHPRYDHVLDVHAAALAGLLDRTPPACAGALPNDPVARVLSHEHRYWDGTVGAFELADPHRDRLDSVVAASTLFGATTDGEAHRLFEALPTFAGEPPNLRTRYLRWVRRLYPGAAELNGLRPNRLGEDHVAATIAEDPGLVTAAAEVATDGQLTQALTVLARGSARHGKLVGAITTVVAARPDRTVPISIGLVI